MRKVSEYTGLNFLQVNELDFDEFALLFRDAYISDLQKTKEGRDYLEDCYILEQTSPNRKRLRDKFGMSNGGGR